MTPMIAALTVFAADPFSKMVASQLINMLPYARREEEAKNKTYKFYVYEETENEGKIFYFKNPEEPDEGADYNPVNSSSDPVALEIKGAGSYKLDKLEPPKTLHVEELRDGAVITGYELEVTGETTDTAIVGGRSKYKK